MYGVCILIVNFFVLVAWLHVCFLGLVVLCCFFVTRLVFQFFVLFVCSLVCFCCCSSF